MTGSNAYRKRMIHIMYRISREGEDADVENHPRSRQSVDHAAELRARELGIAEVIAIVDDGGNFVASHRMDHAWLASVDIAHNKAWTAVALKMPTASLAPLAVPSGELYGINTTNHGRVVVFGGGIPLSFEGRIVGAVGASGSRVANDIEVAKAAVRAFETYPKARIGSSGNLL